MNNVNYRALCHKLEAEIDTALALLSKIPGQHAKAAGEVLLKALLASEEEIIKDVNNLLLFPLRYNS